MVAPIGVAQLLFAITNLALQYSGFDCYLIIPFNHKWSGRRNLKKIQREKDRWRKIVTDYEMELYHLSASGGSHRLETGHQPGLREPVYWMRPSYFFTLQNDHFSLSSKTTIYIGETRTPQMRESGKRQLGLPHPTSQWSTTIWWDPTEKVNQFIYSTQHSCCSEVPRCHCRGQKTFATYRGLRSEPTTSVYPISGICLSGTISNSLSLRGYKGAHIIISVTKMEKSERGQSWWTPFPMVNPGETAL